MKVYLTPVLEKLIQRKIKSGVYKNASEVVRDALRFLEEQEKMKDLKLADLRKELKIGMNQLDKNQYSKKTLATIARAVRKNFSK